MPPKPAPPMRATRPFHEWKRIQRPPRADHGHLVRPVEPAGEAAPPAPGERGAVDLHLAVAALVAADRVVVDHVAAVEPVGRLSEHVRVGADLEAVGGCRGGQAGDGRERQNGHEDAAPPHGNRTAKFVARPARVRILKRFTRPRSATSICSGPPRWGRT